MQLPWVAAAMKNNKSRILVKGIIQSQKKKLKDGKGTEESQNSILCPEEKINCFGRYFPKKTNSCCIEFHREKITLVPPRKKTHDPLYQL